MNAALWTCDICWKPHADEHETSAAQSTTTTSRFGNKERILMLLLLDGFLKSAKRAVCVPFT